MPTKNNNTLYSPDGVEVIEENGSERIRLIGLGYSETPPKGKATSGVKASPETSNASATAKTQTSNAST